MRRRNFNFVLKYFSAKFQPIDGVITQRVRWSYFFPIKQLWCISFSLGGAYMPWRVLFSVASNVSQVWFSAVKALTVNVMGDTSEELTSFTVSFEGSLAVLQASQRNEPPRASLSLRGFSYDGYSNGIELCVRFIKIELCVRLSVLRWFQVGHNV